MGLFYAYLRDTMYPASPGYQHLITFTDRKIADEWWRMISSPPSPYAGHVERLSPQFYVQDTTNSFNVTTFFSHAELPNAKQFLNQVFFTPLTTWGTSTTPPIELTDHISGRWYFIRSKVDPQRHWYFRRIGSACQVCGKKCDTVHVSTEHRTRFFVKARNLASTDPVVLIGKDEISISASNEYTLRINDANYLKATKVPLQNTTADVFRFDDLKNNFVAQIKWDSNGEAMYEYVQAAQVEKDLSEAWELADSVSHRKMLATVGGNKPTDQTTGANEEPSDVETEDLVTDPVVDDSSTSPSQVRFHPTAVFMIKKRISEQLPINLLRLPEMEIWSNQAILNHVESIMKNLESRYAVPSCLRDSEKEPDRIDIIAFVDDKVKWAIFSHRWGEAEPTYEEATENKLSDKPGHQKLRNFCKVAHEKHNAEFVWSDTCCINKKDHSEYARSIRSMYNWYANAPVCIVHLAGTIDNLEHDEWFTRGWTLQELLAPKKLKFYNRNWDPLTELENDKESQEIAVQIERATTITPDDLRHFSPVDPQTKKYEITKRMRWAVRRETMIPEDRAYSIIGIFGVNLGPAYGEGPERALERLLKEILLFSNSPEVLNWAGSRARETHLSSSAFPSSITCFRNSHDTGAIHRDNEALAMTARGLEVNLLILTATSVTQDNGAFALRALGCKLVFPEVLGTSDGGHIQNDTFQYAFGVWNFHSVEGECELTSSDPLEAILLRRTSHKAEWEKVCTKDFIRLEGIEKQDMKAFINKVRV